ncbi:MAG: hypothetical protein KF745_11015 [Phycisphaeraceae bacterium]|nr:hypothetical protein [Phycisphaeraceae bacterium]
MTPPHAITAARCCRHRRRMPRGGIYILVLGLAAVCALIGASAIAVSRLSTRTVADLRDFDECSVLAQSAVDLALARVNANPTWRSTTVSGAITGPVTLGRGSVWYSISDLTDGNLGNNVVDPAQVFAVARIGRAARALAVQASPSSLSPVSALQCSLYASAGLNVNADFSVSGGPAATGGTATIAGGKKLTGNLDASLLLMFGSIDGTASAPVSARSMPPASVYDAYLARATTIPWSNLAMGTITTGVLSPGWNPYGAKNANGIYAIDVPAGNTLTIRTCRLVATLVVNLGAGSKLSVVNSVVWDPPSATQPSLIVRGTALASIDFVGTSTALKESSWNYNFNPPHTPYQGVSNTTMNDSFSSELHGVFHVIGSLTTTSVGADLKIVGCLISDGTVTVSGKNSLIKLDSAIGASPPVGYWSGGAMTAVRGTWQWQQVP